MRELINHLARSLGHNNVAGKDDFIGAIAGQKPFSSWQRRETYWNILGRMPEKSEYCGAYFSDDERARHIWDCLSSDELRQRLIERLSAVFPDRERKIFIHIPRTAGTAVREYIEIKSNIVTWNFAIETQDDISSIRDWSHFALDYDQFLIKFLIQISDLKGIPVIITGHASLGDLLNRNLIGPNDKCFSIVRDPLEIIKSLIKYHFKIARDHADRDDGCLWRSRIGVWDPGWVPDRAPSAYLIHKMIRSECFRQECSNVVTRSFSPDGSIDRGVDNIKLSGCAIFNLAQIDLLERYINKEFSIDGELFMRNESTFCDFDIYDCDYHYLITKIINDDLAIAEQIATLSPQ